MSVLLSASTIGSISESRSSVVSVQPNEQQRNSYKPLSLPPSEIDNQTYKQTANPRHVDPQTVAASINPKLLDSHLTPDEFTTTLLDLQTTADTLATLSSSHSSLQVLIRQLRGGLDSALASRTASVAHLQREILAKEARITSLMSERIFLLNSMEDLKLQARDEVAVAKAAMTSQTAAMETELKTLRERYAQLADFQAHKAQFEANFAALQDELAAEKASHSRDVCELERRNILEKERLKNAMLDKIKATKMSLLAQTRNAVSVTTQRTMAENAEMITELMYQSRETENMAQENERWRSERQQRERERELNTQQSNELLNKCATYHRVIKSLQAELAEVKAQQSNQPINQRHAKPKSAPIRPNTEMIKQAVNQPTLIDLERSKEIGIMQELNKSRRSGEKGR